MSSSASASASATTDMVHMYRFEVLAGIFQPVDPMQIVGKPLYRKLDIADQGVKDLLLLTAESRSWKLPYSPNSVLRRAIEADAT